MWGGGKLIPPLLEGTLFAVDSSGAQCRLVSKDVGGRLHNWERVRATPLTYEKPFRSCP